MQHLQLPPRRGSPNLPHHLPHPPHVLLALARVENDAPSRIIQDILQAGAGVGTREDALQLHHVDPVRRVGGLVRGPGGEGAPVVVLGDLGAEEEVALADHLPDDIDDLEAARRAGVPVEVGGLERGAQPLRRGQEVGGRQEAVAAAAELGGDERGVRDVGNDVVVGEGDVGFLRRVDEVRAQVTLLQRPQVTLGVGAVVGAGVGAADGVFFLDDGEEGGVVAGVDGVGEVVVGVFDEDGAGDVAFLNHGGHGVNDVAGLLFGVEELEFATFLGAQAVEEPLEGRGSVKVLEDQ